MVGTADRKLKCLFIGPLANHAVIGRVAAFAAAGCDMFLINAGHHRWTTEKYPLPDVSIKMTLDDPYYQHNLFPYKHDILELLRIFEIIPEGRAITAQLRTVIFELKPDFCVTHYGPVALHYARIVKRIIPELPIINIINLVPSAFNTAEGLMRFLRGNSLRFEMLNYRKWLQKIDAIFVASQEMLDYIKKFMVSPNKCHIVPDYLPKFFQVQEKNDDIKHFADDSNRPSVIYFGAPERFGHYIDAVDNHFLELAKLGIHIYAGLMANKVIATGFGHIYPQFTNNAIFSGRLAQYAASFGATLVAYNIPPKTERFRSTYPTRFFMGLSAGLPIVLREGYCDACERFVKTYGNGFTYKTAEDLRDTLMDCKFMSSLRKRAQELKPIFSAEVQKQQIREILRRLL